MRPQDKLRDIAKRLSLQHHNRAAETTWAVDELTTLATETAVLERENGKTRRLMNALIQYTKALNADIAAIEHDVDAGKPYNTARYHALCDVRKALVNILIDVGGKSVLK